MWVLALGGVFLAVGEACIFCRLPARALPSRLAQLSSQTEWKEWAPPDFSAFALGSRRLGSPTTVTPHRKQVAREFLAVPLNHCLSPEAQCKHTTSLFLREELCVLGNRVTKTNTKPKKLLEPTEGAAHSCLSPQMRRP